jgi:hypothetical protein
MPHPTSAIYTPSLQAMYLLGIIDFEEGFPATELETDTSSFLLAQTSMG